MKQKDIILIVVIVFISGVFSLLMSHFFFSSPKNRQQTAEVVDVLTPDFATPPSKYFNIDSINPTQEIQIGENGNPNPFNSKPQ